MQPHFSPITAVVIDDNEAHRELICKALAEVAKGWSPICIHEHAHADEALAELPAEGISVIFCDYILEGASGLDWVPDFVRADVGPVILMTASGNEEIAARAFRSGTTDYIVKSTIIEDPESLREAITESIRRYQLGRSNRDLARRLKLANNELTSINQELCEVTDTAHRFVEDVAHEFRTPLSVISEFASILSDGIGGELSQTQREYINFVIDASRDMANLIDDFLDTGKIRAGRLNANRQEHSLQDIISSTRLLLDARAKIKRSTIRTEAPDDLPKVFADADKVKRMIINLAINAIKHSPYDATVHIIADQPTPDDVRVRVRDSGPGLADKIATQLFERFQQGEAQPASFDKGFGLGMNIVRELAALNLSTLSVDNQPGQGCTIAFTLPVHTTSSILNAFLKTCERRSADTILTVIRVVPARSEAAPNSVRNRITAATRATDIVLPTLEDRSIIVVGETDNPKSWIERMRLDIGNSIKSDPKTKPCVFRSEIIGTWSIEDALQGISSDIALTRKAAAHA